MSFNVIKTSSILHATMSAAAQALVGAATDVVFDTLNLNTSNVTYSTVTGIFSLLTRQTYLITTGIRVTTFSAALTGELTFQWVDSGTNVQIVAGGQLICLPQTSSSTDADMCVTSFVYTTGAAQTVKVRCVAATGTGSVQGNVATNRGVSYAVVQQLTI